MKIASMLWADGRPAYVSGVPGDGGKDWGWTREISRARPLSEYWCKRFSADAARLNWRGANVWGLLTMQAIDGSPIMQRWAKVEGRKQGWPYARVLLFDCGCEKRVVVDPGNVAGGIKCSTGKHLLGFDGQVRDIA